MAQGSTALRPLGRQVAFLPAKSITFANTGATKIGTIPRGSRIWDCITAVTTGWSTAGTRVLSVGANSSAYNDIATTITEETASITSHRIGCTLAFTQDTDIYIKLVSTGTAATKGAFTAVVAYLPPNELS
jgi:hypothetical protein